MEPSEIFGVIDGIRSDSLGLIWHWIQWLHVACDCKSRLCQREPIQERLTTRRSHHCFGEATNRDKVSNRRDCGADCGVSAGPGSKPNGPRARGPRACRGASQTKSDRKLMCTIGPQCALDFGTHPGLRGQTCCWNG